jgi:thiol-disulfide isomerase/thioredoxin
MKRRNILRHAALAAAGAGGWFGPLAALRAASLPPHPFYAQAFPDKAGGQVELTSYLGQPLVLNFWATWCPPCVKEMPDLEALHNKHQKVHFVGLAIDTAKNVQAFEKKVQVTYPLLVEGHGGIQLMRGLGNKNGGLPFTVLFDKDGRMVRNILGQIKPDELDQYVADLG